MDTHHQSTVQTQVAREREPQFAVELQHGHETGGCPEPVCRIPVEQRVQDLESALQGIKEFSRSHHLQQSTDVLLHALEIDIPSKCDKALLNRRQAVPTRAGGGMPIGELQRIVRLLSNNAFVRWWAHWNYPQRSPWKMAIAALDADGKPLELPELEHQGFRKSRRDNLIIYEIERTNPDGTAFTLNI